MGSFASSFVRNHSEASHEDNQLDGIQDDSNLRLYHGLARALESGTPTRPGLPLELIIYILKLADCMVLSPSMSLTVKNNFQTVSFGPLKRKTWFCTPPLSKPVIAQIARMQLVTLSRNQGWVSDPDAGSWSWFEVGVLENEGSEQDMGDSDELPTWISHHHPVESQGMEWHGGAYFDADHEIWSHISEGDAIAISGVARYPGWRCVGEEARLIIWKWFQPTLPPRRSLTYRP